MGSGLTFIEVFDVYRVLIGTIAAELLFVEQAAEHRENFAFRFLTGGIACFLFGLLYIPVGWMQKSVFSNSIFSIGSMAVWWLLISIITLCFVYYCYEITLCNLMFQCIFGIALQHFVTVILQYLICKKWFPSLAEEHTVLYICITVCVYGIIGLFTYLIVARRMPETAAAILEEDRKTFISYCILFLFLSVMNNVTGLVFHLADYENGFGSEELFNNYAVPYYCIIVNLIICMAIMLFQGLIYRVISLQQEKRLLLVLQREREQQYLFSKENVDMINQKCHDLKRQIRALKLVREEDREKLFAETEKAVQFYDAQMKTGNDVLDIILTEKSMVCTGYGIRFTCSTQLQNPDRLEFMDVIDLYSMLSNALDNAIECVSKYEDVEKKTISVSIVERGSMLNFIVDNYFEGEVEMKNGLPVTSKEDKNYHGYGVKSMQMIARKYAGELRISVKHHTFSLQIMIPMMMG